MSSTVEPVASPAAVRSTCSAHPSEKGEEMQRLKQKASNAYIHHTDTGSDGTSTAAVQYGWRWWTARGRTVVLLLQPAAACPVGTTTFGPQSLSSDQLN